MAVRKAYSGGVTGVRSRQGGWGTRERGMLSSAGFLLFLFIDARTLDHGMFPSTPGVSHLSSAELFWKHFVFPTDTQK